MTLEVFARVLVVKLVVFNARARHERALHVLLEEITAQSGSFHDFHFCIVVLDLCSNNGVLNSFLHDCYTHFILFERLSKLEERRDDIDHIKLCCVLV